jgi:hypothetical protein
MHYVSIGGDTETCDGDANSFQLSLDGKTAPVFFTRPERVEDDFLQVLDSLPKTKDRCYIVWFHNIKFDLPVLFPSRHSLFRDTEFEFESRGWHIKGIFGALCFVTLRKGDKHVELLGTDSYFKTSLSKLAKTFCPDLPKLEAPKYIGKIFYTEADHDFVAYAERDSVITHAVGTQIVEMHRRYGIPISVSAPHMASRIFRRRFVYEPIPLPQMSVIYASLHAYHGGKNNFPVRKGLYKDTKCLDIKSAYPYAMALLPSFTKRELYFKFVAGGKIKSVPTFGVYQVSGKAKLTPWPILFDAGFKPIYGQFTKVWCTGWEVNRGLQSGLIQLTECEGYYYDAKADKNPSPFKQYVDHFYQMKEKPGIPKWERDFYKLLMNSLYGKFIETRGASSLLNVRYDIDKEETEFSLELVSGGLFNPFIAALITGHTRAYIHNLEIEFKAIHTSTDGIMTQEKIPNSLLSDELGGLSIEAEGDVLLLRNKLYVCYTKDKTKAALGRDEKPLASKTRKGYYIQKYALHGFFADVQTLEVMAATGVSEYEFVKVNQLREALRRGLKVNRFEKQKRKLNLPD